MIVLRSRIVSHLLLILSITAFLSAAILSYQRFTTLHQAKTLYQTTVHLTSSASPAKSQASTASSSTAIDLSALQQINPDVIGWITIPDTILSYPLMQGVEHDFYASHTWEGSKNPVGSIFLESECTPDLSDFHTLIYGHRMRDDTMFGSLKYYQSQEYWNEHPYIQITLPDHTKQYHIFAAFEADLTSPISQIHLSADLDKQQFLDYISKHNVLDTGIHPTVNDHILTLCTCTGRGYNSRLVVLGILETS